MASARHVRSILIAVVLAVLLGRATVLALLILIGWGLGESFWFLRHRGRKGHAALAILVISIVAFVGFQAYQLHCSRVLISKIEGLGASRARMSGRLLPGPVNYISFGPDVGDGELAAILALDGLENVESVVANGSQITDQGLLSLRQFERLDYIYIADTDVTADGIAEFQRKLPDCQIVVPE